MMSKDNDPSQEYTKLTKDEELIALRVAHMRETVDTCIEMSNALGNNEGAIASSIATIVDAYYRRYEDKQIKEAVAIASAIEVAHEAFEGGYHKEYKKNPVATLMALSCSAVENIDNHKVNEAMIAKATEQMDRLPSKDTLKEMLMKAVEDDTVERMVDEAFS